LVGQLVFSKNKSNKRVQNPKVSALFGSIPILWKEISSIKNGELIPVNQFSYVVTSAGLFYDPVKLRFENSTNKKTLKQAWRFFL
jgi:hypothetical protein